MKFLTNERLSEHRYKTPEGYLVCTDAILARTGKQTYKRNEVFADSNDESEIEIDRTPEEVFSEQTLASFENKPLTVEHPDEDVNVHNYKDYAVGFVRDVRRGTANGQDVILGNLVITDEDTIKEVENGEHTELSCGYDCDIIDEEHPCQRNIRGNHVALCEQGRAGIARIVDSEKQKYAVEFAYAGDSISKYLTAVWVMANSKEEALKKAEKWANTKYDETSNFKIVNKAYTNSEIIDNNIDDSAELEKLMKTCQSVASIFVDKTNETEQKVLYSSLFNLVKDITEKADKEADASKLLKLSKTLDNYASKAKTHKGNAQLTALAKELYRYYEKNRSKDSVEDAIKLTPDQYRRIKKYAENSKYDEDEVIKAVETMYARHRYEDIEDCVTEVIDNLIAGKSLLDSVKNNKSIIKGIVFKTDKKLNAPRFTDFIGNGLCKLDDNTYIIFWHDGTSHLEYQQKYDMTEYEAFAISEVNGNIDLSDVEKFSKFGKYKSDVKIKANKYFKDSLVNDVNPRKGESEKDFISRFMSETKEEYPDEKQRLAVAYSYWRNKSRDSIMCDEEQKFVIKFDMGPRRITETYTTKEKADERYKELQVKFANKGVKIMKMYDGYNKFATEKDVGFLKEALSEMRRYERNWSFMTQRERQNISWNGIAGLREDIKNAENRLKELTSKTDSLNDNFKGASHLQECLDLLDDKGIDWSSGDYETGLIFFDDENSAKRAQSILQQNHHSSKFGTRTNSKGHKSIFVEIFDSANNIVDALIPPPEKILREFEQILISNGYTIESKRNNIFGGVHYQIRSKRHDFDKDSFTEEYKRVARALHSFDEKHSHNPPITWNFGLMNDGSITAGLDVRELYVKD